ncbi:MAG: hypothetical protein SNJ62_11220 [Chloracidobacterium sp.]|uniref:Uncharacterized protein n=1 Tax=Chloracidobacterium validum TaxID=2821543 RepID=A0ABX8B5U0_9BACT|nr:hypothetical protein [Chloracidobacterium validum]QUW01981.1 hypothetical protein J8C06_06265 [Chloracidobacterium validum]
MTTKFVPDALKSPTSPTPKPVRRMVRRDRHSTPTFQPSMFEDDLVSALAVATENVRARQVFDWECVRRQRTV